MAYRDLSMREKAALIKLGVANGLTTLDAIEKTYNEYSTGGHLFDEGGESETTNSFVVGNRGEKHYYTFGSPQVAEGYDNVDLLPEYIMESYTSLNDIKPTLGQQNAELSSIDYDNLKYSKYNVPIIWGNVEGGYTDENVFTPSEKQEMNIRETPISENTNMLKTIGDPVIASSVPSIMNSAQVWYEIAKKEHPEVSAYDIRNILDNTTFTHDSFSGFTTPSGSITSDGDYNNEMPTDAHELEHSLRMQLFGNFGAATDYEKELINNAIPYLNLSRVYGDKSEENSLSEKLATNAELRKRLMLNNNMSFEELKDAILNNKISDDEIRKAASDLNGYIYGVDLSDDNIQALRRSLLEVAQNIGTQAPQTDAPLYAALGGNLFTTGGVMYPFSFNKQEQQEVLYGNGGCKK